MTDLEILQAYPQGSASIHYNSEGTPYVRLVGISGKLDPAFVDLIRVSLRWHAKFSSEIRAARGLVKGGEAPHGRGLLATANSP